MLPASVSVTQNVIETPNGDLNTVVCEESPCWIVPVFTHPKHYHAVNEQVVGSTSTLVVGLKLAESGDPLLTTMWPDERGGSSG